MNDLIFKMYERDFSDLMELLASPLEVFEKHLQMLRADKELKQFKIDEYILPTIFKDGIVTAFYQWEDDPRKFLDLILDERSLLQVRKFLYPDFQDICQRACAKLVRNNLIDPPDAKIEELVEYLLQQLEGSDFLDAETSEPTQQSTDNPAKPLPSNRKRWDRFDHEASCLEHIVDYFALLTGKPYEIKEVLFPHGQNQHPKDSRSQNSRGTLSRSAG